MKVALACLVVATILMVVFEHTFTRVLGVAGLVAFIVVGVFALASPERLEDQDE